MVKERVVEPFKLPAETRDRLTVMDDDIQKAKKAIQTLKKIGMDTVDMEEKLEWAENTRKLLLTEFG